LSRNPPRYDTFDFELQGNLAPLVKAAVGAKGHSPSRMLGGWLMTYGKLGPDGGVVPTVDRDGQVMEAARELGHIDWSPYLDGGLWNDTHNEAVIVGAPTNLEFHDGSTPLSQAHGKVGFWTTGHLFDRNDPSSWELYTDTSRWPSGRPSEAELDRADHFWELAQLLKGLPRPIGFSAHGSMALSPCRKRIIWCQVRQAAVCELPKNPDATAELLKGSPLELLVMRKAVPRADTNPCAKCKCPPWSCDGLLRKGGRSVANATTRGGTGSMPLDELGAGTKPEGRNDEGFTPTGHPTMDRVLLAVMRLYFVDQPTAEKWVRRHLLRQRSTRDSSPQEAASNG
jgi:hypothetical protein